MRSTKRTRAGPWTTWLRALPTAGPANLPAATTTPSPPTLTGKRRSTRKRSCPTASEMLSGHARRSDRPPPPGGLAFPPPLPPHGLKASKVVAPRVFGIAKAGAILVAHGTSECEESGKAERSHPAATSPGGKAILACEVLGICHNHNVQGYGGEDTWSV